MNEFMKTLLSLSVSGTLLLLIILGLKQLYKNKISRRWQYYVWIIVVLRFLLPFTLDTTIVGSLFEKYDAGMITNEISAMPHAAVSVNTDNSEAEPIQVGQDITVTNIATHEPFNVYSCLFFVWLVMALVLFVRKVTAYQGFIRYIKAGNKEVSDIRILNFLSGCEEKLNIRTRVELSHNSLLASPIMIGFFHPRIVLPDGELGDKELSYIFLHELIHYKQKDMFYKWVVQLAVCVHWFNPFVYLLEKEVNKSCELSCDEKVISILDDKARREYGDMLLSFLKPTNLYKSSLASVTLSEGAEQLKERLGAIMGFKKKNKVIRILTGVLTLCIIFVAAFMGSYHEASASVPTNTGSYHGASAPMPTDADDPLLIQSDDVPVMETLEINGITFYLVSNEEQLRAIGAGKYDMNLNYMQQADIQLSADEWIPIGTWDNPFTGTYNGNGYEIIGLTMTDPDAEIIGLFGVARDNAQIYNITLRDCDIMSAGRNAAKTSAGAIVAIAYGGHAYDNTVIMSTDDDGQADTRGSVTDAENDMSIIHESADILYYENGWPYIHDILTNNTDRTIIETEYCMLAYDQSGAPLKLYWNFLDSSGESSYDYLVRTDGLNLLPGQTENYHGGWTLYDGEVMDGWSKVGNGDANQVSYSLFCLKQVVFDDDTVWNNPNYENWFKTYAGKKVKIEELQNYYPYKYEIKFK